MTSLLPQREIVEQIQGELRSTFGSRIAPDYENALRLVSEVVFTRSAGFILEFIQNAEDSGAGLKVDGNLAVYLNRERIKIEHNGRPFTEENVRALCGIRSSKRPEQGTLGYLGIGFKSVFKVTDSPIICSGGYQFKFDKSQWPSKTAMWRVLPIWVDKPFEPVNPELTTFIVPFRHASHYELLSRELSNLGLQLYLFLRWLNRITIHDQVNGVTSTLADQGIENGVTTLQRDGTVERFRLFRKTVRVPETVQRDDLTQEYRANVTEREIAIAFALDGDGNLEPTASVAMFGGVYSFIPIGEAGSGARFAIQADFLVQPGRDALNSEASWNGWLVDEVADLCKEAITHFKEHVPWKYQFLPAFAAKATDGEACQRLFGPKLLEPLTTFLASEPVIPTASGGWSRSADLVRMGEGEHEVAELRSLGLFSEEELPIAFGGNPSLQLVHPEVRDGGDDGIKIREVNRVDLLRNEELLASKASEEAGADWFRRLYLWLQRNPIYTQHLHRRRAVYSTRGYHEYPIVLAADGGLLPGGQVHLLDVDAAEPSIVELAAKMASVRHILHPDVLAKAAPDAEREAVRGFLTGLAGVQVVDAAKVCLDALLPRIRTMAERPSASDVVGWTRTCERLLGLNVPSPTEIWVLAQGGEVRPANECLLGTGFRPEEDWERNRQYVPGIRFVDVSYLETGDQEECLRWRGFLRRCGVRGAPANGVEEFAVRFVELKLEKCFAKVTRVEKLNLGYDLVAQAADGSECQVEVKGLSADVDVELTANETAKADEHGASYWLCVVSGIPESPTIYKVPDPAAKGRKDKVTISPPVWKGFRWD